MASPPGPTPAAPCACYDDPCNDAFYDARDKMCWSTCWSESSRAPCAPFRPTRVDTTTAGVDTGAVAFEDDYKAGRSVESPVRDAAACVCAPKHVACRSDGWGMINPGQYGKVEEWDTSRLTWFAAAFHNPFVAGEVAGFAIPENFGGDLENIGRFCGSFDADIGGWDTAAATSLVHMFEGATQFNADIGRWEVSQVESMSDMFKLASSFNANLASWQVSKVTNMRNAFLGTIAFDQNIAGWDVSKLEDYRDAFRFAVSFTQDVLPWIEKAPWADPTYAGITMLKQAYAPKHDLALRPEVLPGQTVRACARVPTAARTYTSRPVFVLGHGCARRHGAPVACRPQSGWRAGWRPHTSTSTPSRARVSLATPLLLPAGRRRCRRAKKHRALRKPRRKAFSWCRNANSTWEPSTQPWPLGAPPMTSPTSWSTSPAWTSSAPSLPTRSACMRRRAGTPTARPLLTP